jgi:hypothetical protein
MPEPGPKEAVERLHAVGPPVCDDTNHLCTFLVVLMMLLLLTGCRDNPPAKGTTKISDMIVTPDVVTYRST